MPDIRHSLLIAATAEVVYTALTSKDGLSGWWTPKVDIFANNSIAKFCFNDDYCKEMKVIGLTPCMHVKWLCIAGTKEWIDTTISFSITSGVPVELLKLRPEMSDQIHQSKSEKVVSILAFKYDDWKENSVMHAECSYTWGRFLHSLKLYCENGTGKPWPYQHS